MSGVQTASRSADGIGRRPSCCRRRSAA